MTQSVQNYDNHNNIYSQQRVQSRQNSAPQMAVRIPDYYMDNDKKSIKDMLEENPFYSMGIKGFFGPLIDHPIASVLTWFGCGFLLDKYTNACGGEYDKSLLKKVTNFGDKLENSKFVQSKPVQSVLNLFKKGGKKSGSIIEKNSVLRAMKNTPTMPELEIVKSEMLSQRQRVVHDFNQIVNELKLTQDGKYVKLNKLALDKKETEQVLKAFKKNNLSEIAEEKVSSYVQLKRLGKSDGEIFNLLSHPDGGVAATKKAVLNALGHNEEWIKKVQEDTIGARINEVQEAAKRVGGKVKIGLGDFRPFGMKLGILTTPTKRVLGCDSVYNRLYSLDTRKTGGAKTATGRFMSRFMQMVHRGLTFGGGKLGVLLFIAPAFVETAINVHKAEPNQKIGTGVNNLVNHISWVFTFPFALQIMHHIFGAQYAGLTKAQVQKIRDLQNNFNKKNKNNGTPDGFKDYKEYNAERKIVNEKIKNELKNVKGGQKWYTSLIRHISKAFTPDLGKLDAYNTGNMITTKISQMRNLPRNMLGVPLRLGIFIALTMGVLDTVLNKSIKLVFGDSYDSMKEEEQKDAKKEQKKFLKEDLNERLYEVQKQKILQSNRKNVNSATQKTQNAQAISHHGSSPLSRDLSQRQKEKIDNYTYIPSQDNIIKSEKKNSQDNYTYIPSQQSTLNTGSNGMNKNSIRTYIPSQAAANINKSWDNSGLQAALERAQRAENRALQVLAGNFEGMN